MARRLSLNRAQPIIIVGWFLSGFMLIGLVVATSSKSTGFWLSPPEEHAFTQAYFYAIYAAALYCVIAAMMIATFFSALTGRSSKEYTLTTAQRTLMLQTIGFLVYLLAGAAVYKNIEGWRYLDAVYWADFTLLTIGIGSPFTPATLLGQALLFPFAIGGILTIGIVIGSVRSLVLDRGKEKLQARFIERKREKSIRSIDPNRETITVSWLKKYKISKEGLSEPQIREEEFLLMRKIESEAAARERWMSLTVSIFATLLLWFMGALVFYFAERKGQEWNYFNALYFAYTSLLTIGYGDYKPESSAGKSFFVLWTLLAIPTLTILISHMGDTIIKTFTDLVLWAGTVTILPGDSAMRENIKLVFQRVFKGVHINPREFAGANQPPGFLPYSEKQNLGMTDGSSNSNDDLDYQTRLRNDIVDRFAKHIAEDELQDMKRSNDPDAYDRYNFVYVLLRELIDVMTHLSDEKPKKFSYRDWAWYLKLLGQDEDDENLHSRPLQTLHGGCNEHDRGKAAGKKKNLKWSWMGVRSPLMSKKTEAGWIAEKLSEVLEQELDSLRTGKKSDRSVPITMRDLANRMKQQGDESGTAETVIGNENPEKEKEA
jgi:potassium channel subfamily K